MSATISKTGPPRRVNLPFTFQDGKLRVTDGISGESKMMMTMVARGSNLRTSLTQVHNRNPGVELNYVWLDGSLILLEETVADYRIVLFNFVI
jgi:hypothetical protein